MNSRFLVFRTRPTLPPNTNTHHAMQTSSSSGWLRASFFASRQTRNAPDATARQSRSLPPAGRPLFPENRAGDTAAAHTAAAPFPAYPQTGFPPFPAPEIVPAAGRLLPPVQWPVRATSNSPANPRPATRYSQSPATIRRFSIRSAGVCCRRQLARASLRNPAPAATRPRWDLPGRAPEYSPASVLPGERTPYYKCNSRVLCQPQLAARGGQNATCTKGLGTAILPAYDAARAKRYQKRSSLRT